MPRSPHALSVVALVLFSAFARPSGSQPTGAASAAGDRAPGEVAAGDGAASASPTAFAAPAPPPRVDPARMREPLEKLVAQVRGWGGRIGVLALDVASGATLAASDEHGLYNPASNAKLLTATAALRLLGPSYRYLTGLYGARSNVNVAELVIRGSGDPSLEMPDLWQMARELRAAGVRKVGAIAVDQSFFDERYVPPAFEQQPEEWAAFRAPVAAVSLNANAVLFTIRATKSGEVASVVVDPPGLVTLAGSVSTGPQGSPEKLGLRLEPRGARLVAHLKGHVPEGGRAVSVAKRVDDPRLLAACALKEILKEVGVEVTGDVRLGGEQQRELLVAHRSAPLGELLSALGKESDNFYAETIFKTIAAEERGRPGTAAAAAELVMETLDGLGAMEKGTIVKNGSGLFDAERTSPWSLATLLRAAHLDPVLGPDFTAQLAIGGVDGTLRGRFKTWKKQRAIRAKTGTLSSTAALSGYVLPPPGRSAIAFSVLANDVAGHIDPTRKAMDAFVGALADALWTGAR